MTVDEAMAHLNAPYDPIEIVRDLLRYAVYDRERDDQCADAVMNALGYLEQEGRDDLALDANPTA